MTSLLISTEKLISKLFQEGKVSSYAIDAAPPDAGTFPARLIVDLAAILWNIDRLTDITGTPEKIMGVVKANAYGHGLLPVSLAMIKKGVKWLAVAQPTDAIRLRDSGIEPDAAKILVLIASQDSPIKEMITKGIDFALHSRAELDAILKTVHMLDYSKGHKKAWVHIALDTGFGRTGFTLDALKKDLPAIKEAVEKNRINVRGIYSHFAFDEAKNHPVTKMQTENFKTALSLLEGAGIKPEFVHFANSAAILNDKNLLFDMCRAGVMLYGVSPSSRMGTGYELSLRPAMTCEARIAMVKNMPKGSGISYDHTYVTERDTRTAIVPIGYADGVSRMASSGLADISGDEVLADGSAEYAVGAKTDPKKGAHLLISSRDYDTLTTKRGTGLSTSDSANTRLCQVIGRVCMDQFIVDVPDKFSIKGGGTALLWGDGRGIAYGEPTIEDWARETHTIPYDTMTRFGKSGIPVYYKNWEVLF